MTALTEKMPEAVKRNPIYRAARAIYFFKESDSYKRFRQAYLRSDAARYRQYLARPGEHKLHIGCGENPLPGWLNTDFLPPDPAIPHLDATKAFPFPGNSFDLVFSEHVIEHVPLAGGLNLINESFRVLQPGGRIRLATPSVPKLIAIYQRPEEPAHRAYREWHERTWLADQPIVTDATVLNDFYRNWGHLCLYDEATMRLALERTGFVEISEHEVGESGDPRLRGLENVGHMPPGLLALHTMTFEAVKPNPA